MDKQLVQFWGAPGEKVSIGKRGQGVGGDGGGNHFYNHQEIYAYGDDAVAEIAGRATTEALQKYDSQAVQRQGINNLRGRTRRITGISK
jgi:hypothetical protein